LTVKAVSGLAMMSSTHASKEKVVLETAGAASTRAGAAATEVAMARATRGRASLTILDVGFGVEASCDLKGGLGNNS
jgi:hypothetical protein